LQAEEPERQIKQAILKERQGMEENFTQRKQTKTKASRQKSIPLVHQPHEVDALQAGRLRTGQ